MPLNKLPAKTYPSFGLSMLDRAVKESFASRCTKADLKAIRQYFTHDGAIHCAYCDSPDPGRWDHIHAVSRGGDTVPGNLVPACGRCDDSKQDREVDEWAKSASKYRPKPEQVALINRRIAKYQKAFGYTPREFKQKLTNSQKAIYERFRVGWEELRRQLQQDGIMK